MNPIKINGERLETPLSRDTFALSDLNNDSFTFETNFEDFTGTFVEHCHVLTHEDLGMMEALEVIPQSRLHHEKRRANNRFVTFGDLMNTINRRNLLRGGAATAIGLAATNLTGGAFARSRSLQATPLASPAVSGSLDDLRARLNGTLMVPGDSGYAVASAPANGRYLDILTVAVARCADEADVVTCISWCNENGISPVGRGGGHSYAGFSTTNGLMIDLRRINSVQVDRKQGTITCGGAALNSDFLIATENGPLFVPGGTCLGVGMGGLTLGGGIGYNTHWAGLTCDHLQSSRIVTASGDILELDPSTNSDLFWACRGGAGGNFGINTSFTYDMVDVPQQNVSFYRFDYQGADAAAAVFAAFDALLHTAPATLNAVAMAEATEIGTGGSREAIHTMTRGQYIGPVNELRELVAPLLEAATPSKQMLEEMAFWDIQRMIASAEPEPHSFGDISRFAAEPLSDSIIANMVDLIADCPGRTDDTNGSIWSLGWVGGDVVNGIARTETAYVHRNVSTLLRPTTVWPNDAPASVSDDLNAWTEEVIAAITPHMLAESYQNFPNRSIPDWEKLYYAENFERLVDVKTTYDSSNLFNNPQSIPTR